MVQIVQVRDVSVWLEKVGLETGFRDLGKGGKGREEGGGGRGRDVLFEKLDASVGKRMIRRAQLATNPLFDC